MPAVFIFGSYMVGSIPFAYLVGRVFKGIDIRKLGDGNAGAANAYQQLRPVAGWSVLIMDACKGAAVVLIAQAYISQLMVFLCGIAAVIGHAWPVYTHFHGGKGQSTVIGVLTALVPRPMFILLAICAAPFLKTRSTRLAGVILFAPLWLVSWLMGASLAVVIYCVGLPCLVGIIHLIKTRRLSSDVKIAAHMR